MAFGKQAAANNPAFRSGAAVLSNQGPRPQGNFNQQAASASRGISRTPRNVPRFVDEYRPSTSMADVVRLIPGNYIQEHLEGEGENVRCVSTMQPFIKYTEHFDGYMEQAAICSAGVWANFKDKRSPCHGCDIYWETCERNSEGRYKSTRMSKQNKFAINVFDFSKYHNIEQVDRVTKQVRMNDKTNKPYMQWTKCQGEMCPHCRGNRETVVGSMRHWPLNWTQFHVLRDVSRNNVSKSCSRCGTANCIQSLAWTCGGCGDCVVDMATTNMTLDDLRTLTENPFKCACGNESYLAEIFICPVCDQRGQEGARADLWEVNLNVTLVEVGTGKDKQRVLQVSGFSAPGPVGPEWLTKIKPFDLVQKYAPDSLEVQAKRFGVGNAPAAATQETGVRTPVTHTLPYINPHE